MTGIHNLQRTHHLLPSMARFGFVFFLITLKIKKVFTFLKEEGERIGEEEKKKKNQRIEINAASKQNISYLVLYRKSLHTSALLLSQKSGT